MPAQECLLDAGEPNANDTSRREQMTHRSLMWGHVAPVRLEYNGANLVTGAEIPEIAERMRVTFHVMAVIHMLSTRIIFAVKEYLYAPASVDVETAYRQLIAGSDETKVLAAARTMVAGKPHFLYRDELDQLKKVIDGR
jgi:hypothetical protein